MEYYAAWKRGGEILPFSMWVNLDLIVPRKLTQTERDQDCIAQLKCGNFQKGIKPMGTESRTIVGRGVGRGG